MRGSTTAASSTMASSNRRQPARSARSSTTRPSNYYARTLPYQTNPNPPSDDAPARIDPPGFFPAITHFTDGLSALPKEVMRHFTLIKETEGKAYLPDQAIGEILDTISKLSEPPNEPIKQHSQPYLGFSLSNSINGSAPGSMVDGNFPATQQSLPEMDDRPQLANEQLDTRRKCFSKLRDNIKAMINVLDEKNMVLTSANDTLARNLARLDGTLPYVEMEVSEEARLGSNTHWALAHMREMRKATGPATNDRSRRDVQAANNLAAAAAAIHEGDIAATRSEARREVLQAKRRHVDSDFDDRPPTKRAPAGAKSRKNQEAAAAADGKGASGAQPYKRRRVEKTSAPGMEQTGSGAPNSKSAAASHRDREVAGDAPVRKKNKPLPAAAVARKRNGPSSPSIASSPTRGTFATTMQKESASAPSAPRGGGNSRGRQNSTLSMKSAAHDGTRNRPPSAVSNTGLPNGTNASTAELKSIVNATSKSIADSRVASKGAYPMADGDVFNTQQGIQGAVVVDGITMSSTLKREEMELADGVELSGTAYNPRGEYANKTGIRTSKPGTPVEGAEGVEGNEAAAVTGMARSRSTRGVNGNGAARTGATANSLATRAADEIAGLRRTQKKTAKATAESNLSSPSPVIPDASLTDTHNPRKGNTDAYVTIEEEEEATRALAEDGYVSSDEPRYCICNGPSYGHMIGCDNEDCPREWFHLACVGMTKLPGPKAKWYCSEECKENMKSKESLRKR